MQVMKVWRETIGERALDLGSCSAVQRFSREGPWLLGFRQTQSQQRMFSVEGLAERVGFEISIRGPHRW
jgi:hypothetical protein